MYDPQSGSIFLGNQNISNITLNSLRKSIAVVPQDTVLFHDTLFYNIHYGRPDANENEVNFNLCKIFRIFILKKNCNFFIINIYIYIF